MCAMLPLTQVLRGGGRRERGGPQTEGGGGAGEGGGDRDCTVALGLATNRQRQSGRAAGNFYHMNLMLPPPTPTPNPVLGSH